MFGLSDGAAMNREARMKTKTLSKGTALILNTGMRTDIPAFYSKWFLKRVEEGFVLVRNPFNPQQVTKYRISPDVVDLIGFCTKNPAPMLPHMDAISDFGQYWFVTITPYGKEIEPRVPDKLKVLRDFQTLSGIVGADSMGWRYDPIFLSETYTVERHLEEFEKIASALAGYTRTCVISFIDLYSKVRNNFPKAESVSRKDRLALGKEMIRIAGTYGMTVKPCAEGDELAPYGADTGGCTTMKTYEAALHCRLVPPKVHGARKECACYLACDIGAYNTCGHMCRYCYANDSEEIIRRNMAAHDPDSPFLVGGPLPDDRVHEAEQESWKDPQMSIFDYMEPAGAIGSCDGSR